MSQTHQSILTYPTANIVQIPAGKGATLFCLNAVLDFYREVRKSLEGLHNNSNHVLDQEAIWAIVSYEGRI